jgi:hypothetical protein
LGSASRFPNIAASRRTKEHAKISVFRDHLLVARLCDLLAMTLLLFVWRQRPQN